MRYRENKLNGDKLSVLGFGCMRFPKSEAETERMVLHAIENGVNFFDTAYIYSGSEARLGRILHKNDKRRDVKIATKIPPYFVKKYSDFDKIFNQQLERLQTDYIDYYFIHMITDASVWQRLVDLGAARWASEKKAAGKIKNIGFSYHGGREEFIKICDSYPWEFCMIQYNYLDENNLAGKSGLTYASEKMPVFIMEPLRGGVLANQLPKEAAQAFGRFPVKRSPAEWAFKWLWNQPEPVCVLSGMNSMEMLTENIRVASETEPGQFTEEEFNIIAAAKKTLAETIRVNCTACGYCMPCPQGVDIPTCFFCYNNIVIGGKMMALMTYLTQTSMKARPQMASLCNSCGLCETKCPQKIEIRKELAHTKKAFEKFFFKPLLFIVKKFMRL